MPLQLLGLDAVHPLDDLVRGDVVRSDHDPELIGEADGVPQRREVSHGTARR